MIPRAHGGDLLEALARLAKADAGIKMQNKFYLGLDLGQSADFSALAILERQKRESASFEAVYHCRHLQRWPLRTSYPAIVADTAHDSYGAWREGAHDDLVLAVCLALWIAESEPKPVTQDAPSYSYSHG